MTTPVEQGVENVKFSFLGWAVVSPEALGKFLGAFLVSGVHIRQWGFPYTSALCL